MGDNFKALTAELQRAVEWKARQNLSMALADGNEKALANQQKFLENSCENLANNQVGLRHILREYKEDVTAHADD